MLRTGGRILIGLAALSLGTLCAPAPESEATQVSATEEPPSPARAYAVLRPLGTAPGTGVVTFRQSGRGIVATAELTDLQPAQYQVRVNAGSDCATPSDPPLVQLADFEVDDRGSADFERSLDAFTLDQDSNSLAGKSVVLASGEDVLACGMIQLDEREGSAHEGSMTHEGSHAEEGSRAE